MQSSWIQKKPAGGWWWVVRPMATDWTRTLTKNMVGVSVSYSVRIFMARDDLLGRGRQLSLLGVEGSVPTFTQLVLLWILRAASQNGWLPTIQWHPHQFEVRRGHVFPCTIFSDYGTLIQPDRHLSSPAGAARRIHKRKHWASSIGHRHYLLFVNIYQRRPKYMIANPHCQDNREAKKEEREVSKICQRKDTKYVMGLHYLTPALPHSLCS